LIYLKAFVTFCYKRWNFAADANSILSSLECDILSQYNYSSKAPILNPDIALQHVSRIRQWPILKGPASGIAADSLRQLVLLRWIAIAGQLSAVGFALLALDVRLPLWQLLTVIALLIGANVATAWWLKNRDVVRVPVFAAHLLIDIGVLTVLLYFTGGGHNPFAGLYAVHVVISAIALPPLHAWVVATSTLACYTYLVFFHLPLRGFDNTPVPERIMTIGTWLSFALAAALITYFVVAIAAAARKKDRQLADAKSAALSEQAIMHVGALAASATHELSSPLSTMTVVVNELQTDDPAAPEFRENLAILARQINVCKTTLSNLMAAAGHARISGGQRVPLDRFLTDVVDKCRLLHPGSRITFQISATDAVPDIVDEQTLGQAILNLLNNAVDASPDSVHLDASWREEILRVHISDWGAGLPADALGKLGKEFFTTKAPGRGNGLGVMLANTIVQRFGGALRVFNRPDGGACAEVVLPLAPLLVATERAYG